MSYLREIGAFFFCFHFAILCAAAADYPIQTALDGPSSIYTQPLLEKLQNWSAGVSNVSGVGGADKPLALRCIETPEQPFYIGLEQVQEINTPIAGVSAVMDDIDGYINIFPDFEKIKVLNKDANLWLTEWEQSVPVPFVPNVRYQVNYLITQADPNRRIYRYQLHKSSQLITSDGFIVIEADGPNRTRYTEVDFYDAHWGLGKVFGREKLWKENVVGIALSDIGLKLKAENPQLGKNELLKAAERYLDENHIDVRCGQKVFATDYFTTTTNRNKK